MTTPAAAPPDRPAMPLVFITGASSGIGLALAERFRRAGWRLALVARRADALQALVERHGWPAGEVGIYAADVRSLPAIAAAARDCLASQGLPDVVIANAGISIGVDCADPADLEVQRALYETNVLGMAGTFQPFIAPMRERGAGTLVGVASVAGLRGIPGHAGYSASKAAAIAYCESLRGDCRSTGVRVVTLLPGYVDTPLTQRNRHSMPFRMTPQAFAERAYAAILRGDSYRVIPWPMAIVGPLLRLLPNRWYDRLMANRPRKPRLHET